MNTGYILLVDDDPILLQALSHTISLRMSGVKVETADSVNLALDLIQQQEYDAVVSDIKMPGMDGLDLLAQVLVRYPDIPVLLITGHGEHELAIRALRGGAYDYIQKPIDRDDFVASLYRALQTRQLRRQIQLQQHSLEQYALSLERQVLQRAREIAATNTEKDILIDTVTQKLLESLSLLKDVVQTTASSVQPLDQGETVQNGIGAVAQCVQRIESLILELKAAQARKVPFPSSSF